jgi:hypothetical protein
LVFLGEATMPFLSSQVFTQLMRYYRKNKKEFSENKKKDEK